MGLQEMFNDNIYMDMAKNGQFFGFTMGSYIITNKYNNYVKMEVFCWSIELPDPSNYGLTLELKPEQKAEASIIARAQQGL